MYGGFDVCWFCVTGFCNLFGIYGIGVYEVHADGLLCGMWALIDFVGCRMLVCCVVGLCACGRILLVLGWCYLVCGLVWY